SYFDINTQFHILETIQTKKYLSSVNQLLILSDMSYDYVSTGDFGKKFLQRQTGSTVSDLLSGKTVVTANTFDNYGNVTASNININNGLDEATVLTTYTTANTTVPAKPTRIQTTRIRVGQPSLTDVTDFEYDVVGRTSKETKYATLPLKDISSY